MWYIVVSIKTKKIMNNRTENLVTNHIQRIQQDVLERDQTTFSDGTRCNPYHAQLDGVDLKNIASLREGRIPQYSDHMDCLSGKDSMDMFEFAEMINEMQHWKGSCLVMRSPG